MKKSVHEFLFSPTMHLKNGKTVRALNSIFQQWQIQAGDSWNMSGEPCSGVALSPRDSVFEDPANNPAIRCDCSFRNNTLCHITGLKIERNFFSGPLPAFLGNMSRLKSLSFSHNRLSGPIPKELGNLKELHTPSIDDNSFSGPIPTELAKLNMLHKLSISQNIFSGHIPKELGNLKNLSLLSLDNNNFSGTLPPELGTLANLEQLYSNSCGFSGEIPSTFANLERLRIVWASDNAFTGKIPDFVGNNWTKLRKLRFQGNSFEGPIPSSFAKLTSLASLRIGDIYNGSSSLDFVRDLKNLTELVLRNVLLTGTLPSYITELNSLEKLDLSFNNLTGTIPSYMFRMNSLKHLFLGNNSLTGAVPNVQTTTLKTIDLSYNLLSGDLPSWVDTIRQLLFPGLECLQRSFPCNRDAPRYAQFAINCGGQQIISDGIVFEGDDRPLGTATYVVPNAQKLAVSNVGLFEYTENYLQNTSAQVRGTDTPELYNSSRISPGSLRYYGLGLENGTYTVNLFFAEIGSLDRTSRRVFDVYIQGTRRLRDFDISKEADGVLRAATRNFTVNITENHLEIHLFWAAIRPKENRTTLIAGVTVAVMVMLLILVFAFFYKKRIGEYEEEEVPVNICTRPITFSFSELKAAPKDFSPSNKLGEGDGRVVAVKQLSTASNHGKSQFIAEVSTISAVQHRNLVKLLGYCIKDKRHLLVYEYLENKSLDQALFGMISLNNAVMLCGRPKTVNTLEDDKSYILDWAWDLHENNQSLELVDPTLAEFDENEALRVVRVALLCTQGSSSMRPPMSRVVAMLAGDIDVSSDITRPSYFIDWNFRDSTGTTHDPGEAPALSSGNVNVSEFSDITEGR
ncbi:hypothetical protein V6N13_084298 [Hibiscus sabdariffa]